ncbi:hypothetical protein HYY72_04875 [Candidatus Woesearchaeota archaeon]|nr:hypothetical protein [Candidatus Woesearchaeota archaeon]
MENYYQAILQLRDASQEIEGFVDSHINGSLRKGIFVSRKKKVRNGVDYYISSNKFTINLGRLLEKRFGGCLKVSEKLFSRDRQSSKDLYRVNVLYRPLPVRIGDVISFKGSLVAVRGIGKKISGMNLFTRKQELIDFRRARFDIAGKVTVIVSKVYPEIEVINPETYQGILLVGAPRGSLKIGQKVKVVVSDNRAFFVK